MRNKLLLTADEIPELSSLYPFIKVFCRVELVVLLSPNEDNGNIVLYQLFFSFTGKYSLFLRKVIFCNIEKKLTRKM